MNWEIRIDVYTLLSIRQITSENLGVEHRKLYSILYGEGNPKKRTYS